MKLTVAGTLPDDFSEIDSALLRKFSADGFSGVAGGIEAIKALGQQGRKRLKGLLEDEGMVLVSPFVVTQTHLRPDDPERPQVVEGFRRAVEVAQEVGVTDIGTSPGSFSSRGRWIAHPDNYDQRGLELLANGLGELTGFFEDAGMYLCLEYGCASVLNTAERVRWVLEEVDSPALKLYADPSNWIHGYEKLLDNTAILNHHFDLLGDWVYGTHARDAWLENHETRTDLELGMHIVTGAAGDGIMDYGTFLKRANAVNPSMWMLIEHTPTERIPAARDYILRVASEVGVAFD